MPEPRRKYCYPYPRPAVTVDCLVLAQEDAQIFVLLIQRKNEPFGGSWALPGGFVDQNEDLADAAYRELSEETGIQNVKLNQFKTYGAPGRDPRGHTVSVVFYGILNARVIALAGDDASRAQWFAVDELPGLAFDHSKILDEFLLKHFS